MIRTDNKIYGTIEITNDVNSENIAIVRNRYKDNLLYIKNKFQTDNMITEIKNNTEYDKIEQFIKEEQDLGSGTQIKNFRIKVYTWTENLFKPVLLSTETNKLVFIDSKKISKHEWKYIIYLAKLGISFFIICGNIDELNSSNIKVNKYVYETNEKLNYTLDEVDITSLEDVEPALYSENKHFKLIISGISNYKDICNILAKVNNTSKNNNNYIIFDRCIRKFTPEEIEKIPKIPSTNKEYVLKTMKGFIRNNSTNEYTEIIKESLEEYFSKQEFKDIVSTIFYNKIVYVVCAFNFILNDILNKKIVYYGIPKKNEEAILYILNKLPNTTLILISPDKNSYNNLELKDSMQLLELENSMEIFDIPAIDERDNIQTLAAQAEDRVNTTLFNGNTLGLYKPGQFDNCETKHLTLTYDEIPIWWNKELYLRPGFLSKGNTAIVPTIFSVIKGVKGSEEQYKDTLSRLIYDKTEVYYGNNFSNSCCEQNNCGMQILRGVDINKTLFSEQKPLYQNNKLNRKEILNSKNYRYKFLSLPKQNLILDKIEELLSHRYVKEGNIQDNQIYIDNILNILLNLNTNILRKIQWYEFYSFNPNVIVVLTDENILSFNDTVLLVFLYLMGFDILVMVPTCYSSIETQVNNNITIDNLCIGQAYYDMHIDNLHEEVIKEKNKKKGILDRIFNRS